jgi:hypothetical protein
MTWPRAVSLLVAAAWLLLACAAPALRKDLVPCALTALACLALIWYGDELGAYRPPPGHPRINRPSPGWLIKLMGWLFLLAAVGASLRGALRGQ